MESVSEELLAAADDYNARNQAMQVRLSIAPAGGALLISVSGDIDTASAARFLDFTKLTIPEAKGCGGLVVDLSEVHYISSMGVGALTTLLAETHKTSVSFSLSRVPSCVRSILEVLGFWEYFNIV
jgi:Anti-anti-sigma regulatory factor (antagonist of anti-sigma factor)